MSKKTADKTEDKCAELRTRIPELPKIMRKQNWIIGAELMEEWLRRGANYRPEIAIPNTDIVQMDWVLSFPRAAKAYQAAIDKKVWLSEKAQERIFRALIRGKVSLPSAAGEKVKFGNIGEGLTRSSDMKQFHKNWQIQFYEFAQNPVMDPLDDLYAALGDFYFYYLVEGWVERLPDENDKPRYKATITRVGVYVMDSYDFNDINPETNKPNTGVRAFHLRRPFGSVALSQPLGNWSCKNNSASKFPLKDYYYVRNIDFRDWREDYGKGRGGDFLVFSDIKVFDTNDSFMLP